jgi:hypothetical protein
MLAVHGEGIVGVQILVVVRIIATRAAVHVAIVILQLVLAHAATVLRERDDLARARLRATTAGFGALAPAAGAAPAGKLAVHGAFLHVAGGSLCRGTAGRTTVRRSNIDAAPLALDAATASDRAGAP